MDGDGSDDDDGEHFSLARDWVEDKEDDDGVTCRALVLHPTKHNRDLVPVPRNLPAALRRPPASIGTLPLETLKQVFRFLPAPSLLAAEMVCRLWRDLASKDDAHWEELCKRTYGISPEQFTPPPDPVKLLYMLTYNSLTEIKYGSGGGSKGGLRFLF